MISSFYTDQELSFPELGMDKALPVSVSLEHWSLSIIPICLGLHPLLPPSPKASSPLHKEPPALGLLSPDLLLYNSKKLLLELTL